MTDQDPIKLAIDALEEINMLACYASEEDIDSREIVLLKIGEKSRAATEALQSQPATDEPETDYSEQYRPERLEYTMCGKIYAKHKDGTSHMFMDVRGWGHLTGGGAKALPHKVAEAIQDGWAKEVCDLWNNKTAATNGLDKVREEGL